ncbi:conserved exported protein of unknown function [Tenacibaculum sp. 190130A14a]|uniref:Uncharacterized protein n=1 Tax=Tenacibaculum polynesiense TaxID=3137857 RepID=A0ABM9P695_9FLAO
MKKVFLLAALFISLASYSQIEFVETTRTEVVSHVEFVYLEKVGEDSYNFYYKNINDPAVNEYVYFTFTNMNNDFGALHKIFLRGFEENPRESYKIKANGDVVWLKFERQHDNEVKVQIKQYVSRDPDVITQSKFISLDEINKLFSNQ